MMRTAALKLSWNVSMGKIYISESIYRCIYHVIFKDVCKIDEYLMSICWSCVSPRGYLSSLVKSNWRTRLLETMGESLFHWGWGIDSTSQCPHLKVRMDHSPSQWPEDQRTCHLCNGTASPSKMLPPLYPNTFISLFIMSQDFRQCTWVHGRAFQEQPWGHQSFPQVISSEWTLVWAPVTPGSCPSVFPGWWP